MLQDSLLLAPWGKGKQRAWVAQHARHGQLGFARVAALVQSKFFGKSVNEFACRTACAACRGQAAGLQGLPFLPCLLEPDAQLVNHPGLPTPTPRGAWCPGGL